MRFRKKMMLERLEREGRSDMVDDKSLVIMNDLDGLEASASNWRRMVHGEPVLYVVGRSGKGMYVNEADCA